MQVRYLFLLAPLMMAQHGCSSDDDRDFDAVAAERDAEANDNPAPVVVFDPANGQLPFPNNVLFAGSDDFTLNIPISDPEAASAGPTTALNLMDGFSTVAPISTAVTASLDPASLLIGETIRVFEAEVTATGAVSGLGAELTAQQLVASEQDNTLAILPLTPLKPATTYAVYITDDVLTTDGEHLGAPGAFGFVRGATPLSGEELTDFNPSLPLLEPLRELTRPLIEAIATADNPVTPNKVSSAWSFTTQGIREVLQSVQDNTSGVLAVAPSGSEVPGVGDAPGLADIWIGGLTLPYYQVAADTSLSGAEAIASASAAITGYWVQEGDPDGVVTRFAPTPLKRSDQTVPVLMAVPNANSPSGGTPPDSGWPIMIYQHGITRNRVDMLLVANTMASQGIAVIAIDMPVHGVRVDEAATLETDPFAFLSNQLHASNNPLAPGERTFEIDLATQDEDGALLGFMPDGTVDSSGTHFYNPGNLPNSRDNLRQAVGDLMALSSAISTMQIVNPADGSMMAFPVDANSKSFLGHSLGAIAGTTFLSYDTSVTSGSLAMPGGGIAQLLANSASFGPTLQGLFTGIAGGFDPAAYQQLLLAAQTVVDSGDPINHAAFLAESNEVAIHMLEVVGEADVSDNDQTVPNAVVVAPLSGTEPLARQLGLMPIAATTMGSGLVRFSRGNHGSLINPASTSNDATVIADTAAATAEMQHQVVTFAVSGGTTIDIANEAVIAPVDAVIRPSAPPPPPPPPMTEPAPDETPADMP